MANWVNITDVLKPYFCSIYTGTNSNLYQNPVEIDKKADSNQILRFKINNSMGNYTLYFTNTHGCGLWDNKTGTSVWDLYGETVNSLLLSTSDVSPASIQGGTWLQRENIAESINTWEKIA